MTVAAPASYRAPLRDALRARCFAGAARRAAVPRIGAEVELIPVDASTGARVPFTHPARGMQRLVRALARRHRWRERCSDKGTSYFEAAGGTISFEPGGQVEFSAYPQPSVTALAGQLQTTVAMLRTAAAEHGVALLDVGVDPASTVEESPLELTVGRYVRMAEYFDAVGPFGARMMRQTASVHVSLDPGEDVRARWRLLNGLAPYVLAMFANSPRYAGALTEHQSYRAHCWRMLDTRRTGVCASPGGDPADDYLCFALGAPDMMRRTTEGGYAAYGEWASRGEWSAEGWDVHLSTLFPEVRPHGYLEVRSADAIPAEWYAAPLVFLAGLAYDRAARHEAAELIGDDPPPLAVAGREGLRDADLANTAYSLAALSLDGARRLGEAYVDGGSLERAEEFFRRYTWQARSPADDARAGSGVADVLGRG